MKLSGLLMMLGATMATAAYDVVPVCTDPKGCEWIPRFILVGYLMKGWRFQEPSNAGLAHYFMKLIPDEPDRVHAIPILVPHEYIVGIQDEFRLLKESEARDEL